MPYSVKFWIFITMGLFIPWSTANIFLRFASDEQTANILLKIAFTLIVFAVYGLYRAHFDLLDPRKYRYLSHLMVAFFFLSTLVSFLPGNLEAVRVGGYWTDRFSVLLSAVFFFYVWIALYVLYLTLKSMDLFQSFYEDFVSQKSFIFIVYSILASIIVGFLLLMFSYVGGMEMDSSLLIFFVAFAHLFLGYLYGLRPMNAMVLTQRLWGFLLIDQSGMLVYKKTFSEEAKLGNLHIFANALYAANHMLIEGLNIETRLTYLEMQDRVVMIYIRNGNMYSLITDYYSNYVAKIFKIFTDQLRQWEIQNIKPRNLILPDMSDLSIIIDQNIEFRPRTQL